MNESSCKPLESRLLSRKCRDHRQIAEMVVIESLPLRQFSSIPTTYAAYCSYWIVRSVGSSCAVSVLEVSGAVGTACGMLLSNFAIACFTSSAAVLMVRSRRAHVRMSEDALDYHIRHAQPIEIAAESTAGRMPAVPLRNATVSLVRMLSVLVIRYLLSANLTAVEGRENHPIDKATKCQRIGSAICEDCSLVRICRAQSVHFEAICKLPDNRNGCTPLASFWFRDDHSILIGKR